MSNDILEDQPVLGSIIVTSQGNGGTLQADGFPGTIGAVNPLVAESEYIRTKLGRVIQGRHEVADGVCDCPLFTTKRGTVVTAETRCVICGRVRGA